MTKSTNVRTNTSSIQVSAGPGAVRREVTVERQMATLGASQVEGITIGPIENRGKRSEHSIESMKSEIEQLIKSGREAGKGLVPLNKPKYTNARLQKIYGDLNTLDESEREVKTIVQTFNERINLEIAKGVGNLVELQEAYRKEAHDLLHDIKKDVKEISRRLNSQSNGRRHSSGGRMEALDIPQLDLNAQLSSGVPMMSDGRHTRPVVESDNPFEKAKNEIDAIIKDSPVGCHSSLEAVQSELDRQRNRVFGGQMVDWAVELKAISALVRKANIIAGNVPNALARSLNAESHDISAPELKPVERRGNGPTENLGVADVKRMPVEDDVFSLMNQNQESGD